MASGLRPDLIIRQVFRPAGTAAPVSDNPAVLVGVHRQLEYRKEAGSFVGGTDNGDYAFPDLLDGSAVEPTTAADSYLRPQVILSNDYGVADVTASATFSNLNNEGVTPSFTLNGGLAATFEVASGDTGSYDSTTGAFVDAAADLLTAGVAAGDIIKVDGVPAFTVTTLTSDDEMAVAKKTHGPLDARVRIGSKDAYGVRTLDYLGSTYDGFVAAGAKVGELLELNGWDERTTTGGLGITATSSGLRTLSATGAFASAVVGDVVLVANDVNQLMPAFTVTSGGTNSVGAANLPSTFASAAVAGSGGYPEKFFTTKHLDFSSGGATYAVKASGATFSAQDGDGERTFTDAARNFTTETVASGDWVVSFKAFSGKLTNVVISGNNTITRATGSWLDDGFVDGMNVLVLNAEDSANKQRLTIVTSSALVLTFAGGLTNNADDDAFILASEEFTPLFEVTATIGTTTMQVTDLANGVLTAAQYGGPLNYAIGRPSAVTDAKSLGAYVSAVSGGNRSIAWPELLTGATLPTAGEYVFNDEGVLLFNISSVETSGPGAGHTSLAFDTVTHKITRTGGTSFLTTGFNNGDYISITGSENAGENDGIYKISTVSSTEIVVDQTLLDVQAINATDTAAVIQKITVQDHTQAGVDLADTDTISDIALSIRKVDNAQYSIIRVVSATSLNVKATVSGDEVTDTTVTGMTCAVTVPDELDSVAYTIEKTLTGGALTGTVLVTYAGRRRDHLDEFLEVTGATLDEMGGPAVPGNPLGLAALTAVGNTDVPVLLLQVGDDTEAGWTTALNFLRTNQVYALAPLTQDETILGLFRTHVANESEPAAKHERILFQSHAFSTQITRWTMSGAETGTYYNDGTAETIDTVTTSGLAALGARAGDVVEATYSGFIPADGFATGTFTARVTNVSVSGGTSTLTLLAAADRPETGADGVVLTALVLKSKVLSTTQLRDAIAAYPATIRSRRVRNLYPDSALLTFDDETNANDTTVGIYGGGTVTDYTIGGWLMCAAAAAMRSGLPASTPLTGRGLTGFQRLVNPMGTNQSYLDVILDAGNFLLAQPAGENGGVQAVRAISTDVSDLVYLEEAVTMQVDNFARKLRKQVTPVLGSTILDEAFFDLFSTISSAVVTQVLRNKEIRELSLSSLTEDPTRADTFLATYQGRPYFSNAKGDITIYI